MATADKFIIVKSFRYNDSLAMHSGNVICECEYKFTLHFKIATFQI